MHRIRWSAMAGIVIMLVTICALTISFLPFFMQEAWPLLWDLALQPVDSPVRSFDAVGPWWHVLPWPALIAIPVSSLVVLVAFMLVAWALLLRRRKA